MAGSKSNIAMQNRWAGYEKLPKCCHRCRHSDADSVDEYTPSAWYCRLGLFLPTRKQSCGRRNEIKRVEG